jgi:hypothetical protein
MKLEYPILPHYQRTQRMIAPGHDKWPKPADFVFPLSRQRSSCSSPSQYPAAVREHRGGLPTMTADGPHIVGPASAIRGFYFASAAMSRAYGSPRHWVEALAAWIIDGAPPIDLTPLSVSRFGAGPWPDGELKKQAAWQYRHFYGAR